MLCRPHTKESFREDGDEEPSIKPRISISVNRKRRPRLHIEKTRVKLSSSLSSDSESDPDTDSASDSDSSSSSSSCSDSSNLTSFTPLCIDALGRQRVPPSDSLTELSILENEYDYSDSDTSSLAPSDLDDRSPLPRPNTASPFFRRAAGSHDDITFRRCESDSKLNDSFSPRSPWVQSALIRRRRSMRHTPTETTRLHRSYSRTGNKIVNQYEVLRKIGKGSHGKIHLVRDRHSKTLYAMKILSVRNAMKRQCFIPGRSRAVLEKELSDKYLREIDVMRELCHPNVVQLFEVIHDVRRQRLFLILEYVDGGSVMPSDPSEWRPLPEERAWNYFRELISGLEYLHTRVRVLHCDLKPANLLVCPEDDTLKIADFGESVSFEQETKAQLSRSQTTPEFTAPELCARAGPVNGMKTDVWSAGVCLFAFLFGRLPFRCPQRFGVFRAIQEQALEFPESPQYPEGVYDLLRQILCKDPDKRIDIAEIKTHRWVTRDGQCPMLDLDDYRFQPIEARGAAPQEDKLSPSPTEAAEESP